jgi:hypothetical protein
MIVLTAVTAPQLVTELLFSREFDGSTADGENVFRIITREPRRTSQRATVFFAPPFHHAPR